VLLKVLLSTSQSVPAAHAPDYRRFFHACLGWKGSSQDHRQLSKAAFSILQAGENKGQTKAGVRT
jgi:hypothetical protein